MIASGVADFCSKPSEAMSSTKEGRVLLGDMAERKKDEEDEEKVERHSKGGLGTSNLEERNLALGL